MLRLLAIALVLSACQSEPSDAPPTSEPPTASVDAPTVADAPPADVLPSASPTDAPVADPAGVAPGSTFDGFGLLYGSLPPRGAYGDCFIYDRERFGDLYHVVLRTSDDPATIEIRAPLSGEALEACPDTPEGSQHEARLDQGFRFRGRVSAGDDPYLLFDAATQFGGVIQIVDEASGRLLNADAGYSDADIAPTVTASGHLVFDRFVGTGDEVPGVCDGSEDPATAAVVERVSLSLSDMDETTEPRRCLG